jgi:hypothetical protein
MSFRMRAAMGGIIQKSKVFIPLGACSQFEQVFCP